jgi:hypothetical protein
VVAQVNVILLMDQVMVAMVAVVMVDEEEAQTQFLVLPIQAVVAEVVRVMPLVQMEPTAVQVL